VVELVLTTTDNDKSNARHIFDRLSDQREEIVSLYDNAAETRASYQDAEQGSNNVEPLQAFIDEWRTNCMQLLVNAHFKDPTAA